MKRSKRGYPLGSGNRLADKATKQAAEGLGVTSEAPIKALMLAELPELILDSPKYTEAQNQLAKAEGAIQTEKGWWELPSGKFIVTGGAGTQSGKPNTPSNPPRPCCLLTG